MKIWLLTSQFPPAPGGIARYVANAAEMFARGGHRVSVLAPGEADGETTLPGGARLVQFAPRESRFLDDPPGGPPDTHPAFPYNVLSRWPALSYEFAERAAELARRDGELPDAIESQEYAALPYYLLQRRLVEPQHPLARVPLLVHLHSPEFVLARVDQRPRYRLPGYWVGQMEKFAILAADALLCPSQYMVGDIVRDLPQAAGRISVTPLPYAPLPPVERRPVPGDLVYFGRLEARKGVLELAQACASLWERGRDFTLTLIGGDELFAPRAQPMGDYLRQRFRRWVDAGRLVITGEPLPPPALWQRLARAWAVAIPSRWENFPNACIEAMSLGVPVVASTSGGQAELVGDDGRCGLLFDWGRPGDCEAALERALALSGAEQAAMGEAARRRALSLTSFEAVLPRREAHFEQLIATSAAPPRSFPCVTPGVAGNALPPDAASAPGLLSVVVPFYNLGAYVEETIASIAASAYRPLEVVVVDDGSDDAASVAALERARARHPELVRVHRTPNRGLAAARNAGAELARGEFVAFVDADDLVEPAFFERAVGVLRRYANVSFAYSWVRFFGEHEGCWPTFNTELPYMLAHNMLTAMAVVRRADFLAHGRNSPELAYAMEDYDGWLGMVGAGCVGVSIPELLVRYRMRPGSMLRQMGDDQAVYLADLIARRHPALYRRFGEELFGLLNANGRSFQWNHPAVANDAPDTPPLRRYIADLQQQHRDLSARWQQQQETIADLQRQLRELRRPRGYWRAVVRPRIGRAVRPLRAAARAVLRRPAVRDARPWARGSGPRVLFASGPGGAPRRYRVLHQLEQLALTGVAHAYYGEDDTRLLKALRSADVLYLYRVRLTPVVEQALADARARGVPVVYDTDDLIWDERLVEYCRLDHYYSPGEVAHFREHFRDTAALMRRCDAFVASTPYLADALRQFFPKPTYVNTNAASRQSLAISRPLYARRMARPPADTVTIAYFSGWPKAHEEDLAVALPGVLAALRDNPHCRLRIVGHLDTASLPESLRGQVETASFVPWEKLPAEIAAVDINLAPIVDNPHRRSKSAVKFLEAALVGTPTVASRLEPYNDIQHGVSGMLARSDDEWRAAIGALAASAELRRSVGRAARDQVLAHDTTAARAPGFAELLRSLAQKNL